MKTLKWIYHHINRLIMLAACIGFAIYAAFAIATSFWNYVIGMLVCLPFALGFLGIAKMFDEAFD